MDYLHRTNCLNEEEFYLDKLQKIFGGPPYTTVPREPTMVLRGVFVGSQADAENIQLLRRIGITHLINTSGRPKILKGQKRSPFTYTEHGIQGYLQVEADDDDDYLISAHFRQIFKYIWETRKTGGQVLIYGEGVSRSGAICLGYMIHRGMYLLEAARLLKDCRYTVLGNINFMRQLIEYAKENGLLDPEPTKVRMPHTYGHGGDRKRIITSLQPHVSLTNIWWRSDSSKTKDDVHQF